MSDTVALAFIAALQIITMAIINRRLKSACGNDRCRETITRISKAASIREKPM